MSAAALTASEAAAASGVPLKQVYRIIDAGLLTGAVERRTGARLIHGPALLALKFAHATSEVLKPEARRRAVRILLEKPGGSVVHDHGVVVELGGMRAELEEGLAELDAAKRMVATDRRVMGGAPCFVGTRIPVHDVAGLLAMGETPKSLMPHYPALDERRIRLAPVYAAAYPRRGRPRAVDLSPGEATVFKTFRYEDLPDA